MKNFEFIALCACTMMLTALGIDIMLPALAKLREYYGLAADSTEASKVIAFFFMGQIAQIVFGPLSDHFGRLAILRAGFPLYIIGGIAAAFAPSLDYMIASRFVAGMGASAVFMSTIAGVRDRYVGDKMAHIMSLIFTIFLLTPIYAPFLGVGILSISSWRMVLLTPPLFAAIVFVWSFRLEESLPKENRIRLNVRNTIRSVKAVFSNKKFLRYTGVTTLLFCALSSYVSSSEHIIGVIYGKPQWFAWIFASMGAVASMSAFTNSYLSSKFGARLTIRGLLVLYSIVGGILLLFSINGLPDMFTFFVCIALLLGINLAVEPNSSALALEPMGDSAGLASSVYGTFFFFIGAALGSVISYYMADGVLPLVSSFFVIGVASLALAFGDK